MFPPLLQRPVAAARSAAMRWLTAVSVLGLLTAALTAITFATPASAAGSYQQVTGFGSNPGNLQMFTYIPTGLPSGAPIVVALHGCTQSADAYYNNSGWPKYADTWRFAVIFPQTTSANNSLSCFQWFDSTKDSRGVGEAASIVQMVDYVKSKYGSDGHRVFVTGLSAGGGMTADLLADYPDVFAGGAVDSGLPAHCATALTGASSCQNSNQNLTPKQWGDKVRNAYPGYTGPWPRVAIWQGTADYTVYPVNATELRDQWTNVWGISQTPSSTNTLPGNTTQTVYNDSSGKPAVQVYSISGMGHGLAVDPGSGGEQCGATGAYFLDTICSSYYTAKFWGLDGTGGGTGSLPAPTGLTVTGTTSSSVSLSWNAVDGAASYAIYRNGTKVAAPTSTTYTDTGLTAGTSYSYTVAAVDGSGSTGTASPAVTAKTSGGGTAQCFTATNAAHVTAGRAHLVGWETYANGSNKDMGLYSYFVTHTLKQTATNYYTLADTGCAS